MILGHSVPQSPLIMQPYGNRDTLKILFPLQKQDLMVSSWHDMLQYRREVCKILEAACDYVLKEESNNQASHEIEAISLTWKTVVVNPCVVPTDRYFQHIEEDGRWSKWTSSPQYICTYCMIQKRSNTVTSN